MIKQMRQLGPENFGPTIVLDDGDEPVRPLACFAYDTPPRDDKQVIKILSSDEEDAYATPSKKRRRTFKDEGDGNQRSVKRAATMQPDASIFQGTVDLVNEPEMGTPSPPERFRGSSMPEEEIQATFEVPRYLGERSTFEETIQRSLELYAAEATGQAEKPKKVTPCKRCRAHGLRCFQVGELPRSRCIPCQRDEVQEVCSKEIEGRRPEGSGSLGPSGEDAHGDRAGASGRTLVRDLASGPEVLKLEDDMLAALQRNKGQNVQQEGS